MYRQHPVNLDQWSIGAANQANCEVISMISKRSPVPIYVQIQDMILSKIENGQLEPHDQIPSEMQLASTYRVSRATIQKAIDRLEMDGIVYRQQGKGTFVAAPEKIEPLPILFSSGQSLERLGKRVHTRILELYAKPVDPFIANRMDMQPGEQVIVIERLRMVDGVPLIVHIAYLPSRLFQGILKLDLEKETLTRAMEQVSGQYIVSASIEVSASLARARDAELLRIPADSPVLVFDEKCTSNRGSVVRLTRAIFRADRFKVMAEKSNTPDVNVVLVLPDEK